LAEWCRTVWREDFADSDDGLVERLLYVWPNPEPIARLGESSATDAAERRTTLYTAARRLRALEMGSDNFGTPAPRAIGLDNDALMLFDEQRQEAMRRAQGGSGVAAGWHGKNPGRILRLALVFELLAWAAREDDAPEPTTISAEAVVRAGGYIDYCAAMLERVIGGLVISRAEIDAAQIARHLRNLAQGAPKHARLKPLNERELYQRSGFAWARDSNRRSTALSVLRDAGWVRVLEAADGPGRRRCDWEVNPRILGDNQ
jgi:hypothetical protein